MFNIINKDLKWYKYLILFWFIFLSVILIVYLFRYDATKQVLSYKVDFNSSYAFFVILGKNSLVFIYILLSMRTSKLNIYISIVVNAIYIGLLISSFKYIEYLLLLLPHGALEFMVLFTLAAIVCENIDHGNREYKPLVNQIIFLYIGLVIAAVIESWLTPALVIKFLL